MSTFSSISNPLDSLNAARASRARDAVIDDTQLKTSEDTEKVAKKFEALLIHNMLKAMRSTTLGEKPSNERAMYDDMFDQHLSKMLSESGGLGVASSISRQLNAQQGIDNKQSESSLSNMKLSMNALSNRPSTLAHNGQVTSIDVNINQYQNLMASAKSASRLNDTNNSSINLANITIANIKAPIAAGEQSFGETKKHFIDTLMPDAKRSAARLGIKPDIVIAIAALETGWGKHMIKDASGASTNNLFGIKAHSTQTPHTMHKTTEFVGNKPTIVDAPFRRYSSNSSSITDFADFILTNPRYQKALDVGSDNSAFLRELQRAGYATDPEYANKAINVLQQIESIRKSPAL